MNKVVSLEELVDVVQMLRDKKKKIVFTNGVYDILHVGHIETLEKSRALGDVLIVGINSDASTKQFKGDKRPIYTQEDRAQMLAALACVDYVTVFNASGPQELFAIIKPDIWTKSGSLDPERLKQEAPIVEQYGGRFHQLPVVLEKSTTKTIERILDVYRDLQK